MFDAPKAVLDFPALSPPLGVTPDFNRTSSDQSWYYIYVPILTIIPAMFIVVHLYTKLKIAHKIESSDYYIVASYVLMLLLIILSRIPLGYGLGVHQWNLHIGDLMRQLYWINILEALYCPCIFLIKTAIVLQYLGILAPIRNGNRLMWYGGRIIVIGMFIFYAVDMAVTLFICVPREKIWNPFYEGGRCGNQITLHIASASVNAASDLIILLLPIQSVSNLRISRKKKISISLQFATGILATFAGVMRLSYMIRLKKQGHRQDMSWEICWMGLWAFTEIALGIILACALSLPRLFRAKSKEFSHLFSIISHPLSSLRSTEPGTKKSIPDTSFLSDLTLQEVHEKSEIRKTTEIVQVPARSESPSNEGFHVFLPRPSNNYLQEDHFV